MTFILLQKIQKVVDPKNLENLVLPSLKVEHNIILLISRYFTKTKIFGRKLTALDIN